MHWFWINYFSHHRCIHTHLSVRLFLIRLWRNEWVYKLEIYHSKLSVVFSLLKKTLHFIFCSVQFSLILDFFLKKMDVLKKLSEVKPNKPYHGFAKLDIGYHQIHCFRSVKNKFRKKNDGPVKSILIELEDEVLFLPQYFCEKINEDNIRELNSCIEGGENIYLYFGGKHGDSMWVLKSCIWFKSV